MPVVVIECFILVPAPHEPVVLRLDRRATIRQVKSALERKRGWPCGQQKLRLENGRDTYDAQSLVSLRLHKQAFPTLQLHLVDLGLRMPSFGAGVPEVQVELSGDERAALAIQRITRGKHARQQYEDERLWLAVRAMCAKTEMRNAGCIQRKWRQSRGARAARTAAMRAAREAREVEAAGAIQRVHRNRQRRLNPKRNQAAWLREMLAEAEEDSQSECSTGRESNGVASPLAETSSSSASPNNSPGMPTAAFSSVEMAAQQAQPTRAAGSAQVPSRGPEPTSLVPCVA